jgi:hypothetical protein
LLLLSLAHIFLWGLFLWGWGWGLTGVDWGGVSGLVLLGITGLVLLGLTGVGMGSTFAGRFFTCKLSLE